MRFVVQSVLLLLFPTIASAQSTWCVPDDFPSIQKAISSSSKGDTIIVPPGTYYENIDFKGMAVTLKSQSGPEVTVIDGRQMGSVVTCDSGESPATVLDGFTITNGSGTLIWDEYSGGGMFIQYANPTVVHCIFSGNSASYGGGMYNLNFAPKRTIC